MNRIDSDLVAIMTPEEIAEVEKNAHAVWADMVSHGPGSAVSLYTTSAHTRDFYQQYSEFSAHVKALHEVQLQPLIKGVTIISRSGGRA